MHFIISNNSTERYTKHDKTLTAWHADDIMHAYYCVDAL